MIEEVHVTLHFVVLTKNVVFYRCTLWGEKQRSTGTIVKKKKKKKNLIASFSFQNLTFSFKQPGPDRCAVNLCVGVRGCVFVCRVFIQSCGNVREKSQAIMHSEHLNRSNLHMGTQTLHFVQPRNRVR